MSSIIDKKYKFVNLFFSLHLWVTVTRQYKSGNISSFLGLIQNVWARRLDGYGTANIVQQFIVIKLLTFLAQLRQ